MLVVQAFQHQALPLEEVTGLEGVQGATGPPGPAGYLEPRVCAFEVHIQVTAEHVATQFQTNKRIGRPAGRCPGYSLSAWH